MSFGKESNVRVGKRSNLGTLEQMHPHELITYLSLAGIFIMFSMLMVVFTGAQLYAVKQASVKLPVAFIYSTIVILVSSATVWMACKAQKSEQYKVMVAWLTATLSLGLLFLALQLIGWNELQLQGIYLNGEVAGSYLYLISGLHLLHLVAGFVFIGFVMSHALKATLDSIGTLIYSTDKYRILQMKLLSIYWHFLGILWAGMFLVFFLLI